ncbi:outer membrane lipoprotein chaperone LolA [Flocculibacter collagenilyticus]|uniref:outer membrane lipoprotein chaperone LolA n=1 Tax=Flocculibacter collagenilyticus TaxID=2744479 RepID=UPI0018F74BA7|nr:outer membrane lipoprotein chaperone LolA [Flocculibacter collagenilyticus]
MNKRLKIIFSLAGLFSVFGNNGLVFAHENSEHQSTTQHVESSKEKVAGFKSVLSKFQHFSADFTQTVIDTEGKTVMSGHGKVKIKQPNRLRWHAIEPDENILVSDGKTLYLHNVFLEQVSLYHTKDAINSTPFVLLSDPDSQYWTDYNIVSTDSGYRIVAKSESAQVKTLSILLNKEKIKGFEVEDGTGQLSKFHFNNVNTTDEIADNAFTFDMPEDVDIDDQRTALVNQ